MMYVAGTIINNTSLGTTVLYMDSAGLVTSKSNALQLLVTLTKK